MLRSPLCPASPPPTLIRSLRRREVELVVDDDDVLRLLDAVAADERPHGLP